MGSARAARAAAGRWAALARLTRDLPEYLRTPITPEQAVAIIRARLHARGERLLRLAGDAIFGHPRSPYLRLLEAAGCELGDLRSLVGKEGVEAALARLADAGVYVTFDEFKGRAEVVRGSRRFAFVEDDFDNPRLSPHIQVQSGGTRGPGTSVKMELSHIADLAATTALALRVHGLSECSHVAWAAGPLPILLGAKLGRGALTWFYPLRPIPRRLQVVQHSLALVGRVAGRPLPTPTLLDLREPGRLAAWLGRRAGRGRGVCVTAYASSAVRVAAAAQERGIRLDGVCFITLGEPFTAAKRRTLEAAGARALVRYAFTEAGIIGFGCPHPRRSDDLHLFRDSYGVVQRSRPVGDGGPAVDAFLFTSLVPAVPKILLNVESGDYGLIERRECGCGFEAVGLGDHISQIRSFEKLSGEGMTFVKTDLLRVLEETLPARFGGTSADYQALEQEGADGILRLRLVVSPRIGSVDEASVRRTFLEELGRDDRVSEAMARVWERAGTVEVRRQWPVATRAGKILPFHLVKG